MTFEEVLDQAVAVFPFGRRRLTYRTSSWPLPTR